MRGCLVSLANQILERGVFQDAIEEQIDAAITAGFIWRENRDCNRRGKCHFSHQEAA